MPDLHARILSCAALAAALLVEPALAQTADRPAIKVGDRWQFVRYWATPSTEPNRAWVINSVSSTRIEGTENGEPLLLTPDLGVLDSPWSRDSNPQGLRFPLEIGKRWRFTTDWLFKPKGSAGKADAEVAVVGYEKVKVPAGEFDAFKLVSKGTLSGTSPTIGSKYDAVVTTTYWYAPAARAVVKSVSQNPYLGTSTVDLLGYQLQP